MKVSKSGKKILEEPFEILKTAKRQVAAKEKIIQPEPGERRKPEEGKSFLEEEKLKEKSRRLLEALETEIKEIRKQKKLEEEEKLKEEELKMQKEEEKKQKPLAEPPTRRPRKILAGMKGKLQKLKRRAEIRMPPSG